MQEYQALTTSSQQDKQKLGSDILYWYLCDTHKLCLDKFATKCHELLANFGATSWKKEVAPSNLIRPFAYYQLTNGR